MAILDWLKHPRQRALEAEARLNAADAERGFEVPLSAESRGLRLAAHRATANAYAGQHEASVPLRQGASEEARARAFVADLYRRVGPSEASRLADVMVRDVQMLSRGGV